MSKITGQSVAKPCRNCPFTGYSYAYPCSNLKHARQVMCKSDTEMAGLIDVSRGTWWRYRQGNQKPPFSVCYMLHVMIGNFP